MDYATLRPALRTLIAALTSDTPSARAQVVDADSKQPIVSAAVGQIVKLSVGSVAQVGTDEKRTVYVPLDEEDETSDALEDSLCGVRVLPVRMVCESYDQSDGRIAFQTLENVRKRLARRSSGEALRAVGLSLLDTGSTLDLSVPRDSAQASIAALDVRFNAQFSERDPGRYQYVESFQIGGTLREGSKETEIPDHVIDGSTD